MSITVVLYKVIKPYRISSPLRVIRANFTATAKQFTRIQEIDSDVPYESSRVHKNADGEPERGWALTREAAIEHARNVERHQIKVAQAAIEAAELRLAALDALQENA
jgi:hypothetical protein